MVCGFPDLGKRMFKNYLHIAYRNLVKHQIHSIINILGLSVGIGISILIMIPAGMKLWLNKFATHINIEAWLFFLAAVLAIIVALVTISFQAFHSAQANPVEALQYE